MNKVDIETLVLTTMKDHQRLIAGIGKCSCGLPIIDSWQYREHTADVLSDAILALIGSVQ